MKLIKTMTLCGMLVMGGMSVMGWASDDKKEAAPVAAAQPAPVEKPIVQIAILLDTSSSMSGLINQARSQLWKVVNEFALSERNGQKPALQVALYEYGNSGLSQGEGFIRQIVPLSNDLDKVSEELFKLTTNGGDEFCGHVIQSATNGLAWSSEKNAYKAIFIAGNEPFTQGSVNYADACKAAIQKGILVNTIHCGSSSAGMDGKWQDGAALADGKFLNIDQNQVAVHIDAPQDAEIAKLGVEINKTYIAFGSNGNQLKMRQSAQDSNAEKAEAGAATQRAVSKASEFYNNSTWDVVDACKRENRKLEDFKADELPEEMRKMTLEERKLYVEKKGKEREALQKKITELNLERNKFVTEALKKKAETGVETLDSAMVKVIREQGEAKALKFK
jgi:von Willebrand factor type A domain